MLNREVGISQHGPAAVRGANFTVPLGFTWEGEASYESKSEELPI